MHTNYQPGTVQTTMLNQMVPMEENRFPLVQVEAKIRVPDQLIGRLIGKSGIGLKKIMEETQSHISINDSRNQPDLQQFQTPELLDRVITIRGISFGSVMGAERQVQQKLRQFHEHDLNLNNYATGVAGAGVAGQPQSQQQQQSYCQTPAGMLLNTATDHNHPHSQMGAYITTPTAAGGFTAAPVPPHTAYAYNTAQCIPMGVSPQSFYIQNPAAAAANFPHLQTGHFSAQNVPVHSIPITIKSRVYVPNQIVGILIGTKGQTIKSVIAESGAIINIEGDRCGGGDQRKGAGSAMAQSMMGGKDASTAAPTPPTPLIARSPPTDTAEEEGKLGQEEGRHAMEGNTEHQKNNVLGGEAVEGSASAGDQQHDADNDGGALEMRSLAGVEPIGGGDGTQHGKSDDGGEEAEKTAGEENNKAMLETAKSGQSLLEEQQAGTGIVVGNEMEKEEGSQQSKSPVEEQTMHKTSTAQQKSEDNIIGAAASAAISSSSISGNAAAPKANAVNATNTSANGNGSFAASKGPASSAHSAWHHQQQKGIITGAVNGANGNNNGPPAERERSVFIQGYDFQVAKAQCWVFQKLAENQNKHFDEVSLTCEAIVPSKVIGRIIGKGGHNVKQLQQRSNAHIKIPDDVNADDKNRNEAPVRIVGNFYALQMVQQHFGLLINEAEWRESREYDERRARYGVGGCREGSR